MTSKTNLGGAISVTGTSLLAIGTLSQLSQLSPTSNVMSAHTLAIMWYIALAGFILIAIGKGITAYFSADAQDVSVMATKVETVAKAVDAINQTGSDAAAKPVQITPNVVKL